jgi:hypothetical protein
MEGLHRSHAVDALDCGSEALNRFLARYAWQNQQAGASRTSVALADQVVVGYYTLALVYEHFGFSPLPTPITSTA